MGSTIRAHPTDHDAPAAWIASELSAAGIWDALEEETTLPIPRAFRDPNEGDDMDEEEPVPHALPRRYWAKATLGALARKEAVETWCTLLNSTLSRYGDGFEEMLKGLSAFTDLALFRVCIFHSFHCYALT